VEAEVKIDAKEAAELAIEAGALVAMLSRALRKDDDGVVRLDTSESRELMRRLLGLARSIALALLD
jgi:hypothetical protein